MVRMRITALAGGVGGARFLRGLVHHLQRTEQHGHRAGGPDGGESPGPSGRAGGPAGGGGPAGPVELTVIGNTGDDITLHGLRVCPDLDTLAYTLGGGVHEEQGWGRAEETFAASEELARLGSGPDWFRLGDRDLATHIARTRWLSQGGTLSQVTARVGQRWGLPERGVRLLPVTDDPIETHVVLEDAAGGERAVHFQQWWVQDRARTPALRFTVAGLDRAAAAPGVLDALRQADVVLLPPSNPVVSIGIILGVPGVRDALRGTRAPVVGVSPIIGGAPVRGHADACLAPLGVEVSAAGVAGLYEDFLDGWLVDTGDAPPAGGGYRSGLVVRARELRMRDAGGAEALAGAALQLALELR